MPIIGDSDFVFTTTGNGPLYLNTDAKETLDKISGVTDYRLHDLRRSARTILSRKALHVSHDVAELCLGHEPLPGGLVRKTYDRHAYIDEKAEAFDKLASEIDRIVSGDAERQDHPSVLRGEQCHEHEVVFRDPRGND